MEKLILETKQTSREKENVQDAKPRRNNKVPLFLEKFLHPRGQSADSRKG